MSPADAHEDADAPSRANELRSVIAFELGDTLLGAPVEVVDAVDELPAVTPIPMSHAHVLGLVNWRGRPLPLVSIERFAGLAEARVRDEDEAPRRMLVVRGAGMTVAIRCDRVRGVVVVPSAATTVDVSPGRALEALLAGQITIGDELMLELDVPKFLDASRLRA